MTVKLFLPTYLLRNVLSTPTYFFQLINTERTNKHLTEINDLNRAYNDNLDLLVEHSDRFLSQMCDSLNLTKTHLFDSYLIYENNISLVLTLNFNTIERLNYIKAQLLSLLETIPHHNTPLVGTLALASGNLTTTLTILNNNNAVSTTSSPPFRCRGSAGLTITAPSHGSPMQCA